MKKGDINKDKYLKLRGLAPLIAHECGCDKDYLRKVLSGRTVPKTNRAKKIALIYSTADRLLQSLDNNLTDCNQQ